MTVRLRRFGPALAFVLGLGAGLSSPVHGARDRVPAGQVRHRQALTDALMEHRSALAPLESLLHLADFYLAHAMPRKALEIYLFGLLRAPDDPRFLGGTAQLFLDLDLPRDARPYAARWAAVAPSDAAARSALTRADAALAALAAAMASPTTTAAAGPPPATAGAAPTPPSDSAGASATTTPPPPPPSRSEKLQALSIMKAVAASVRSYNLNHPRDPMTKLDLDVLTKDKVLPSAVDLGTFRGRLTLDGTRVGIEGLGTQDSLETELADYRTRLARFNGFVARGETAEAVDAAEDLARAFPDDADLVFPRLAALVQMSRGPEAAALARRLVEAMPGRPRPLFELLMVQYRSGDGPGARATAARMRRDHGDSHWARLADQIARLVDRDVSFDVLSSLIEARRSLLSTTKTAGTTGTTVTTGSDGQ